MKDIENHLASNLICLFLSLIQQDRNIPLTFEEPALFAIDVSKMEETKVLEIVQNSIIMPGYPIAMQLLLSESGIYADARSMMAWHDRYSLCPTCGTKTRLEDGEYMRTCEDMQCRRHRGNK